MTISSANRKSGPYTGNGEVTLFPFRFKVFKTADVLVTFTDANGADQQLRLDSDYTVTLNVDQDNNPGGVVTYPRVGSSHQVLASTEHLTLTGSQALLQPTDLPNLSPWFPQVVEDALDRLTIIDQQLQEQIDRSIKISVSDSPLTPLPPAANRANELLGFDALGNVVLYPLTSSVGAGDRAPFSLVAGIDFNPGDTHVTLPRAPGAQGNLEVNFDASPQDFTQWQVVDRTLTFTTPIPGGVARVWGYIGTTLSTSTPPVDSVSDDQLLYGDYLPRVVASVADMQNLNVSKYQRAITNGYFAGGQGGAHYYYDQSYSQANADGVVAHASNTGTGCWRLLPGQRITVARAGARPGTNATAAFQAAVNAVAATGGGKVYGSVGTYILDSVVFPYDPLTIDFVGAGMAATILQQNDPTKPLFRVNRTTPNARMTGATFSDFAVKAAASGSVADSTHIGIDTVGFDAATFKNIRFLSNGTGSCYAMFRTAAAPQLTYQQTFDNIQVANQVGPAYVLSTQNNGQGVLYNTNIIKVSNCWFYNNSSMIAPLDMSNCTNYAIDNCEFETSGNYGVILGSNGLLTQNWIEGCTIAPLQFQATASVSSSRNTMIGCQFSGFSGAFSIPAFCDDNVFLNCPGGNWTISKGSSSTRVAIIGGMDSSFGPAPTLAQTFGTAGSLTLGSATLSGTNGGVWKLLYTFTPPAGNTQYGFTLTPPSGFSIAELSAGALIGASGTPCVSSIADGGQFYVTAPSTSAITLTLYVSMQ
ncbi:hypothetical protein R20233_02367 [Ralstonia sp. LMG 32965]|uniref:hypothetical protein n=1 Tax=Ralstonia flatus TaxID=3058601 RepID=UPI0028F6B2D9|nr:hypothetical protein [Ralstonia sp. LMG 32965]CAJ0877886.1 hypothetical protein R20233_02367 [Ralstonia sp. LMG 32965]